MPAKRKLPTEKAQQTQYVEPSDGLSKPHENFRLNEMRMSLAAEAAETGLWSLNLQTRIFWMNDQARRIFNFPEAGDISFDQFLEKVHPDDHAKIDEAIRKLLHEKVTSSIEYRILEADGTVRWLISKGALNLCPDQSATCIMGATADITERKQAKENLERQIRFQSLLFEISTSFARLTSTDEVDAHIRMALGKILGFFQGDRCGLVMLNTITKQCFVTHAFYREGVTEVPPDIDLVPLFPWSIRMITECRYFHFNVLEDLPPGAETDRRSWKAMGVKSSYHVPLQTQGDERYVLVVQSLVKPIFFTDEMQQLHIIGNVFLQALKRKAMDDELRNSYSEIKKLKDNLQLEADYLRAEIRLATSHEQIVGQSETLKKVLELVEQVAPTSSTVLVFGETGTGKELVARAIHNLSPRRDRLMIKVNCASLPSPLVESELFGREKGAYTGALTRQAGRFELADQSTIFLDEISELSLELQSKLLRVLQEGEFERLGSPRTIKVNVRIIAATNRNLMEEVRKGKFREDLYYRLNVFPIFVPPLRERTGDIPMLVWKFIREYNDKMGRKIQKVSKKDIALLQSYSWPGNIRELRNVIEHAVITSTGDELKVRLPEDHVSDTTRNATLEELEAAHIKRVLQQTGWRIKGDGGAAHVLGLNPSTLYSRMKKLGISIPHSEKDNIST